MVAAFALMAGHKTLNPSSPLQQSRALAEFTKGNVVVVRVGTGSTPLAGSGTAAACFLDEYSADKKLVQSIPLPVTESGLNKALTLSGTATSEGYITRSADGLTLALAGYNAPPGTPGVNGATSTVSRVVALISQDGTINTTTSLSDAATGNNVRGAFSNGTDIWVTGGAGGLRYATRGATSSVQVATAPVNLRAVHIFGSQLYISTASGSAVRIGAVGTGSPKVTGQAITNLPGLPSGTGSPHQFFMADLNAAIEGPDVLYIADDNTTTGGILKYSLVNGNWNANGTAGTATDLYRGITGRVSGNIVTLFAVRNGGIGTAGGGELVSFVDNSGYNTTISATPDLIATAGVNQAFRGVALAPELAALPLNLLSFTSVQKGNAVAHNWITEQETGVNNFELERSADGEHFTLISKVKAKNSRAGSYQFIESNLLPETRYYRLKIIDLDGRVSFSRINRLSISGNSALAIYPNPVLDKATIRFEKVIQSGRLTVSTIDGTSVREIALSPGMQETNIDLSGIRSGIYIVQANINGNKKTIRLEKK
jgi:hypothetical protein